MKRSVPVILYLVALLPLSAAEFTSDISLFQDEQPCVIDDGVYLLRDAPFEIRIKEINEEIAVQIFIYHTGRMFEAIRFPLACDESEMFAPGTGIAVDVDPETQEVDLYASEAGEGHNYIHNERRINTGGGAVIRVGGIADKYNRVMAARAAFMTLFADFNKNRIIEENELANIRLRFISGGPATDKNTKVYISTLGFKMTLKKHVFPEGKYILVKVSSKSDALKLHTLLRDTDFGYARLAEQVDFNSEVIYFLFSPPTDRLFLDQPYHFNNDNTLIFELQSSPAGNEYLAVRHIGLDRKNDVFSFKIRDSQGRLITPVQYDLNQ
ncbi:MAG: hypothetical protein JW874_04175 [Spirochaetales bacterium]|nr:hypothetical protein [Spirochaetales bacterium]